MKFIVVEVRPTDPDRHEHAFLKAGGLVAPSIVRMRSDSPNIGDLVLSCDGNAVPKVGDVFDLEMVPPAASPEPAPEPEPTEATPVPST